MAGEVNPHKIDDKQERRAEQLKDKFEHQGMGQDEARNRAQEEVAQQTNTGGGNSGGDSRKGANNQGGATQRESEQRIEVSLGSPSLQGTQRGPTTEMTGEEDRLAVACTGRDGLHHGWSSGRPGSTA